MNLGDIWGASDKPKEEVFNVPHGMDPKLVFEEGVRAGKRSLMSKIEKYFTTGDGLGHTDMKTMEILDCTPEELDALILDDPDVFAIDRLPVIYSAFKRYLAQVEADKTRRLFT